MISCGLKLNGFAFDGELDRRTGDFDPYWCLPRVGEFDLDGDDGFETYPLVGANGGPNVVGKYAVLGMFPTLFRDRGELCIKILPWLPCSEIESVMKIADLGRGLVVGVLEVDPGVSCADPIVV